MRLAALALLVAAASAAPAAQPPSQSGGQLVLLDGAVQGGLVRGRAPAGTVALLVDGRPLPFASDGRFILGFDRDHPGSAILEARLSDGRVVERSVTVAPRGWRIEHVNIAQRPSVPDEAYRRRREAELERIRAARSQSTSAEGWRQRFVWPARGRISGLFGAQRIFRGVPAAYHGGVDVAAGAGALVVAPADGVVVLAGPPMFSLEGNLVIVDHGMGLNSAFLHLSSVRVTVGQRLRQGDPIGAVGATGR
ncbi:M23 family metallopeptidase, partial [Allosphingosinicella sp.]|uniref:M23 family metallopeptidase n=1 Tax=Allosphingosinicella sp. TaxID=2823234 RepID=UPI002F1D82BB